MASLPVEFTVSAPATGGLAQGTLVAGVIATLIAIESADRLAAGDFKTLPRRPGPRNRHAGQRAVGVRGRASRWERQDRRRPRRGRRHRGARVPPATAAFRRRRSLTQLDLTKSARREQIDLAELGTQTAQRFRLAADEAKMTLRVRASRICVTTDPRLVETVVNNFVSNAIRYTAPRGTVTIGVRRCRTAAVIAVRDTGTGITAGHLERIFDRLPYPGSPLAQDKPQGKSGPKTTRSS